VAIDRLSATKPVEKALSPQPPNGVERFLPVQWGDGKNGVVDELGHHSPDADHNAGAELGVADGAQDQLRISPYLLLH